MAATAHLRFMGGLAFVGKAGSNHWVAMDSNLEGLPPMAASSPKEMLLLAVGGCTGMDVASLLAKRRVPFRKLELDLSAETAAEHPRVYTRIALVYKLEGEVPVAEAERAVKLSQDKYCSVSAMVRKACPIHWTVEINGAPVLEGGDP